MLSRSISLFTHLSPLKKNKITVVMIGCPLIAVSFNILVDQPITGQQKA